MLRVKVVSTADRLPNLAVVFSYRYHARLVRECYAATTIALAGEL
jgi:hypothetical protein